MHGYIAAPVSLYTHAVIAIYIDAPRALGENIAAFSFIRIQKYYVSNMERLLVHLLRQTKHYLNQSVQNAELMKSLTMRF